MSHAAMLFLDEEAFSGNSPKQAILVQSSSSWTILNFNI